MKNKSVISFLLLVLTVLSVFVSCGPKKTEPPKLETVKEELISRIEKSVEINKVFFGDGLETVKRDSTEAKESGIYETYSDKDFFISWEIVKYDCGYISIDDIKEKAEEAYSKSFLEGIYTAQFLGVFDYINGVALEAHYFEDDDHIYKNTDPENPFLIESKSRIFNYDTMKMKEKESSGERIFIEIESHLENESEVITGTLVFDKDEKGSWLLSSPTY